MTAVLGTETDSVEEVAPGVHRLPVVLPNEGLRSVNVYALVDADGVDLVDCGMHTEESQGALLDGLASIGAGVDDIRNVFVTHHHLDHYTLGSALRRDHSFTLHLGEGERDNVRAARRTTEGMGERGFVSDMRRIAFPAELGELAMPDAPVLGVGGWDEPDRWIRDGDVLSSRSRMLTAIATPGHTKGHLVFHDADSALLFTGDHILPKITPSIGFESSGRPRTALQDFLGSLLLVLQMPDARMCPAHGAVTASTHARARDLIAHHEERLAATRAVLESAGRPVTAYDVALGLTWTRRQRALEELDPFNQYLAAAETAAHLDVLAHRALARRTSHHDGSLTGDPDLYEAGHGPNPTDHAQEDQR